MERAAEPPLLKVRQDTAWSLSAAFVVMVALFAVAPFVAYPVFVMNALCFALFACAFNLLLGYVGLLSFGHALFFGWASYLCAYAAKRWGVPPELAVLVGTTTAAVLGLVAGAIAIRRQGIYFAMITLALAQMMYFFALRAPLTGGEDGIQAVPRGRLFGRVRSVRRDDDVRVRPRRRARRLPPHLSHHQLAVRRSPQGDPRERATRHLARLQDRPLQARRLRALGDARRGSPDH